MQNNIIRLGHISSTNSYATERLKTGELNSGDVILTDFQESGRGIDRNKWISEKGKNLLASYIWIPSSFKAEKQFNISMAITLAIHDFLAGCNVCPVIKWPNDILIDKKKICGILIENTVFKENIKTSVIGFGLNLNQQEFDKNLIATSLILETGIYYENEQVLQKIITNLESNLSLIENNMYKEIKARYFSNLFLYNELHEYKTMKGILHGKIVDVLDTGELVVQDEENREHRFMFKEISF